MAEAAEEGMAELPAFDSMCQAADEGVVVPVDANAEAPIRIAVLGLENNPFWIPVKEGTLVAADELAGQLLLAERVGPERAHVEGDLSGGQVPDVEVGLGKVLLALVELWERQQPDSLDLVRFVVDHEFPLDPSFPIHRAPCRNTVAMPDLSGTPTYWRF